jgi:hypothetical protein
MTYEELFRIAGARLDTVEEAMQMLDPSDMGKKEYTATVRAYNRFSETGNLNDFDTVASNLSRVLGYKI